MSSDSDPTVRVSSVPPAPRGPITHTRKKVDEKPSEAATPSPPKTLREAILANPWPAVAVVVSGTLSFTAIALWAPADVRTLLFGAHGVVFTLVGWLIESPRASK